MIRLENNQKLSPHLNFRKYWLISVTSLQNNLAYSANVLFDVFFYTFIIFIFIQLWRTVFSDGTPIAGYNLNQMIWYGIIAEMVSFSGSTVFQDLNSEIKGGNIAYALNKPYHYIGYLLANGAGTIIFKLVINSLVGVILGLTLVGPLTDLQFFSLPLTILAVLNGVLLNFLIMTCLGLTAFWLEENIAFFWIYQKLLFMLGLFLPIEFFPGWLQKISLLLPFSYITYGPAKLAVDFSLSVFYRIIGIQFLMIMIFGFAAFAIYRKGVKLLNVNGG